MDVFDNGDSILVWTSIYPHHCWSLAMDGISLVPFLSFYFFSVSMSLSMVSAGYFRTPNHTWTILQWKSLGINSQHMPTYNGISLEEKKMCSKLVKLIQFTSNSKQTDSIQYSDIFWFVPRKLQTNFQDKTKMKATTPITRELRVLYFST